MTGPDRTSTGLPGWLGLSLAAFASLYIQLINGAPLYYFDTLGYLDHGQKILAQVGIDLRAPVEVEGDGSGGSAEHDGLVNASRSAVYSVAAALIAFSVGPWAVSVGHALTLAATAWLIAATLRQQIDGGIRTATLFSIPLVIAGLSTLPFFVAFMMPDIFVGQMIAIAALLAVFGRQMSLPAKVVAFLLVSTAVISHPSHFLIAIILVPVSALAALLVSRRGWWMAPLILTLAIASTLAERQVFRGAVEAQIQAELQYYPYITARLIEDQVGLAYLDEHCPDEEIATCRLREALSWSDDPWRLTASHIIFETSPELGSFRLLPVRAQKEIADEQMRFAIQTALWSPGQTALAILRNTFLQTRENSIWMTVPERKVLEGLQKHPSVPDGFVRYGRLSNNRNWIEPVNFAHNLVHGASAAVLLVLLLWPGYSVPYRLRIFALVVLAGILANAFVCGAVSQPAARYGARVIWLLPYLAAIMAIVARHRYLALRHGEEFA